MDAKTIKVKESKNVQSRLIDVNTLEDPQSRSEMYLHFIDGTGRIAFDQLPKPQSRIEWLLMYLCEQIHQSNIGGGGGTGGLTEAQVQAMINKLLLVLSADENFLQLMGVNNQVLSNIPLMTDQQVQDIKNLFV